MSNNQHPVIEPIHLKDKYNPSLRFYCIGGRVWTDANTLAKYLYKSAQSIAAMIRVNGVVESVGPYKPNRTEPSRLLYSVEDCLEHLNRHLFYMDSKEGLLNAHSECLSFVSGGEPKRDREVQQPRQSVLAVDPANNTASLVSLKEELVRISPDLFNKMTRKCEDLNKKWGLSIEPHDMVLSYESIKELVSEDHKRDD